MIKAELRLSDSVTVQNNDTMVLVKVSEGTLEGVHVQNEVGGSFYSFKGIPYAEPPIGDLRFKAPQPPKSWTGVRSAKEHGPKCYQVDLFMNQTEGTFSEDCLYLNVYSPNLKPDKPMPVMVWIHGGGFFSGSGNDTLYGPEFLIRHGIILVTLNYRLDILGLLCLDIEEVPGNAGLKDQVAALRWVKKNISNFGGDPENITIFGESAGGASVSYHLISPMSKGLFKRAIAQSGVSLCHWSFIDEPREKAITFARKLGFTSTDPYKIYEYLKSLPVETIVKLSVPVTYDELAMMPVAMSFAVVSEKKFGDNEAFFSGSIDDITHQGIHKDVDVMSGFTEHDGTVGFFVRGGFNNISKIAEFLEFFCPLKLKYKCTRKQILEIGRLMRSRYLKDDLIVKDKVLDILRYCSMEDIMFDHIRWNKIVASSSRNKSYLYKFTCKSALNIFVDMLGQRDDLGPGHFVAHGDDLMYLFPMKATAMKIDKDSKEFKMIETVTTLWTNFAKYGNPTPDSSLGAHWAPFTLERQEYLDIGEQLVSATEPEREDVEFFESVYEKYMPGQLQ